MTVPHPPAEGAPAPKPREAGAGAAPQIAAIARELGLGLADAQVGALVAYLALLQRWNAVYNLTAVRDPEAMLSQHLADSLAVVPALRRHLQAHAAAGRPRLLDVGSGGGLPGVVLAIACPGLDVTCIDTVGKKANFIRQVAAELRLPNLHAVHGRVEALRGRDFDIVTSRAFASLRDFTSWSLGALAGQGVWLAMKGRHPEAELAGLGPDVDVFHVEPLRVPGLAAERRLIWLRPRAPAAAG